MPSYNSQNANPFVLKKEGEFGKALLAYASEYADAQSEGNEFIAQVCFDQMIDVELLNLLKKERKFDNLTDMKREIGGRLKTTLTEREASTDRFDEHFANSWGKFARKGKPSLSVRKERLLVSGSNANKRSN